MNNQNSNQYNDNFDKRREYNYINKLCPMNGYTSPQNHDSLRACVNMIQQFDKKYGIGKYNELSTWTGYFSSYFR
jgi:hypothetical protein